MRRPTLIIVALLLAAAPAFAQTTQEVEQKILEESNAYRAKKDAPKLVLDDELNAIVQKHARGMAKADKYGDEDKNGHLWEGKNPAERMKAAGYKYSAFGENVGWNVGHNDPAGVMMKAWLESTGHEKNLANAAFTHVGIGAAKAKSGKWYFVQAFAKPTGKTTTVKVTIENQTKRALAFRIGTLSYELKAGKEQEFVRSTTGAKIQLGITWPGAEKEKVFDLADKAAYVLTEKEKDKFAFEKKGSD